MIEKIEFENSRVTVLLSGTVDADDLLDAMKRIRSHHDFSSICQELWKTAPDTKFDVVGEDLMRVVSHARSEPAPNPALKIAMVAGSSLAFGIGRMYEAYLGEATWQFSVFSCLSAAEDWFLSHPDFEISANNQLN